MIEYLSLSAFRPKVQNCINGYLSLSEHQSLVIGLYSKGKMFVFGNREAPMKEMYDIGSVSKTVTAHLFLKIAQDYSIDLNRRVSDFIDLPRGEYPTLYQLLTHTAGYGHLTPAEITVPSLLSHGYSRKNIYSSCTADTVIKCLAKREGKAAHGYSYSDFPFAILAVVSEKITGRSFADMIEEFVQNDLGMKSTVISLPEDTRTPIAALGKRKIDFWRWDRDNPYIAGGGLISSVEDMLAYIAVQIESERPYVTSAHVLCESSLSEKRDIATCIGWHTYKKSNQLWHVGGVGTFRSSVIVNRARRLGVVVLGNSKGRTSANVHYLTKMLYSEIKIKKIQLKSAEIQ